MKPGPTPPLPDDETPDPLLTTLRQRLGDYGAAPSPAAWAAIRQRVATPPRPWWRRPRRSLPLLVLVLGGLLLGILAGHRGQLAGGLPTARRGAGDSAPAHSTLAASSSPTANVPSQPVSTGPSHPSNSLNTTAPGQPINSSLDATALGQPVSADPNHPPAATRPTATEVATRHATTTARRLAPVASAARSAGQRSAKASVVTSVAGRPVALQRHSGSTVAASTRNLKPTSAGAGNRLRRRDSAITAPQEVEPKTRYANWQKATAATSRAASRRATTGLAGGRGLPSAQSATTRKATVATGESAAATRRAGSLASTQHTRSQLLAAVPTSRRRSRRHQAAQRAGWLTKLPASATDILELATMTGHAPTAQPTGLQLPLFAEHGAALDLLALKQAGLLLPETAQPTIPAARPDSVPPAHAPRRWSVLGLAGPTLSYRTLGPAPTLAAGHPDFARLERPALGLGAQVQVRRVLSGRWALAVGVGFHEYATQLALSLHDTTSVHQRDTYRLLTVPVQLGYALGAPKGKLTKALLLGIEPGWYLEGRSTEGADCGCHQQTYSATGSPYRAWSLALSLGLDLRYRLGSADSRWQWLVQPTGRYVATPFVRSDAVGFTRRQPWSLGLLTGFSWDLR